MFKMGNCSINPKANLPVAVDDMPKPTGSRNILIVGGGIAGMQAAITAVDRGHKVTLVEKSDKLGGILNFTKVDVNKNDLWNFMNTLLYEIQIRRVNVKLNTEVNTDFIQKMKPEVLILALGSSPLMPSIPGIDHTLNALKVYDQPSNIRKRVVMIRGGLVGCETGLHLAKTGHDVIVIEMLKRLANESFGMYREALILEMQKYNVIGKTGTRCIEVTSTGVNVENEDGTQEFIEADTVVYALGMKANDTSELHSAAGGIPVLEAGDCVRARNVEEAVKEGFMAAMDIL